MIVDGTKYVEVDTAQERFEGLSNKEMLQEALKLIREQFSGKIVGSADNRAFVNGTSAREYTHPAKKLDDETYAAKMRASAELDNLVEASSFVKHSADDGRHERAAGGWDTYKTLFSVNGDMYEGDVQIMNTASGRLFYDVTQIKKSTAQRAIADQQEPGSRGRIHERYSSYRDGNSEETARQLPASEGGNTMDSIADFRENVNPATEHATQVVRADVAGRMNLPEWTKGIKGGLVRRDTLGKNISQKQMAEMRMLSALGKKYGVVVVTEDTISAGDATANAAYEGGNVFRVAMDAEEGAYTYFITHEMAHYLKRNNAEGYEMVAEAARTWADAAGIDFDARVQSVTGKYAAAGQNLSREMAQEEIVGDILGNIFADENAARVMLFDLPNTTLEKIRDFIRDVIATVREAAARIAGAKDLSSLMKLEGWAEQAASILDAAMVETRNANKQKVSPIRYAVREGVSITDEQIQKNIKTVSEMETVATLKGNEFDLDEGGLVKNVSEYFRGMGGSVEHPILGTVILNRRGVKDSFSHGIGQLKAIGFAAVPDVLRNGKIIDAQNDWKNRSYDTFVVAAPVRVADGAYAGEYYVGAVVVRTPDVQRYYLHELITQKREDARSTGTPLASSTPGGTSSPSLNSILEKVQDVKAEREIPTPEDAVRYSLKDVTEGVNVEAIARENKRLSKLYDAFVERVGDVKPYKGKIQPDYIEKQARRLLREYKSKYDKNTLVHNLTQVAKYFDSVAEKGSVDGEFLLNVFADIMRPVMEASTEVERTKWEEGAPLREFLKGRRRSRQISWLQWDVRLFGVFAVRSRESYIPDGQRRFRVLYRKQLFQHEKGVCAHGRVCFDLAG